MKVSKIKTLLVITTWVISVALSGCNKSNANGNIDATQAMQTETIQITTESTQSTTTEIASEIASEQVLEESSSQISQEVSINSDITTNNIPEVPDIKTEEKVNLDFVANLKISNSVNQMLVVSASGSTATVSMHEIQNGEWAQIMSTQGYVGKQGVGKASESASITPAGIYTLSIAFGVKDNPGTSLPYTKIDDSDYWVDYPGSKYYNTFQSTSDPAVVASWVSAEHIIKFPKPYAYVIAIDYNLDCIPNEGSAIFLHCSNGNPTAGCVSIPEAEMIFVLQHIHSGCVIVIDTANGIYKY